MCNSIKMDSPNLDSNENVFCTNIDHALYMRSKKHIMQNSKEIGIRVSEDTIDDMFKHPMKEYTTWTVTQV